MKHKQLFIYCFCGVGFIISIFLKSRSFGLGFLFCIVFHLLANNPERYKLRLMYGMLCLSIIAVASFYWKHDSSLGRLLIYKVSFQMWKDHPTGIGFEHFKKFYLQYQANYFKSGKYTKKELLLADNTWFAFNDYLQIVLENGIVGLGIVAFYFILIFKFCNKYFKLAKKPFIFGIAITALLTISIAAVFNHIYERQWCQVILIVTVITLLFYTWQEFLIRQWPIMIIAAIIIILTSYQIFKTNVVDKTAYSKFQESDDLERAGFKTESLKLLNSIYHILNNDPEYLDRYGKQLYYSDNLSKAIIILNKALSIRAYSYNYVLLGDCYRAIGDYQKSERCYLNAIFMVPNRFRSRYALYELYKSTGQTAKLVLVEKDMINLPVKIPSPWISHIKFEMQNDR